jgi:hypothetical protein
MKLAKVPVFFLFGSFSSTRWCLGLSPSGATHPHTFFLLLSVTLRRGEERRVGKEGKERKKERKERKGKEKGKEKRKEKGKERKLVFLVEVSRCH